MQAEAMLKAQQAQQEAQLRAYEAALDAKSKQFDLAIKAAEAQLAEQTGPGRKPTHEIVQVESDWKSYWGSSKELLNDVKALGEDHFECIILKLCRTKKELTYYEMHYQCINECLVSPSFSYNDNILGKFFKKDLVV